MLVCFELDRTRTDASMRAPLRTSHQSSSSWNLWRLRAYCPGACGCRGGEVTSFVYCATGRSHLPKKRHRAARRTYAPARIAQCFLCALSTIVSLSRDSSAASSTSHWTRVCHRRGMASRVSICRWPLSRSPYASAACYQSRNADRLRGLRNHRWCVGPGTCAAFSGVVADYSAGALSQIAL